MSNKVNELIKSAADMSALTPETAVLTMLTAFLVGIMVSFTYMKTHGKGASSQSMALTLVMLPSIIAIIILLVGNNVARAFGLSGAFAIVRFRSAAGDPKDLTYVFFSLAAGLACGVGMFGYAVLFAVILCLFMTILYISRYGVSKLSYKQLKITIPEDLDYQGVFDEVFERYTYNYELKRVKTTDLGTLYELIYNITIKDNISQKDFMDEIRCRNGNLNVILTLITETKEY